MNLGNTLASYYLVIKVSYDCLKRLSPQLTVAASALYCAMLYASLPVLILQE